MTHDAIRRHWDAVLGNALGETCARSLRNVAENAHARGRTITAIDLSDRRLREEDMSYIEEALSYTPELKELYFGADFFGSPDANAVGRSRDAGRKHYDADAGAKMPDAVSPLTRALARTPMLEVLDLRYNNLPQNDIALLAAALPRLPALRVLNVTGNSLSDESTVRILADTFMLMHVGGAARLKELHIARTGITDRGALAVRDMLQVLVDLEVLDISDTLGSGGVEVVAEGLRHTPKLQKLLMNSVRIDAAGVPRLAQALAALPQLEVLLLEGDLWRSVIAALLRACATACPMLRELDISSRSLRNESAELADLVPRLHGLTTLNISHCSLGSEGLVPLTAALGRCTRLTRLNASNNPMGAEEATALCTSLAELSLLEELDLCRINLAPDSVAAVADGLRSLLRLRVLRLDYNRHVCHGDAAAVLADGLRHLRALRVLSVSYTALQDRGLIAVAESLRGTPDLEELYMSGNGKFSLDGVTALASVLPMLSKLKTFHFAQNDCNDTMIVTLAGSLADHPDLEFLDLSGSQAMHLEPAAISAGARLACKLPSLHTLALRYSRFDAASAATLACAMRKRLVHLDLSGSALSADAAASLIPGLCGSWSARSLVQHTAGSMNEVATIVVLQGLHVDSRQYGGTTSADAILEDRAADPFQATYRRQDLHAARHALAAAWARGLAAARRAPALTSRFLRRSAVPASVHARMSVATNVIQRDAPGPGGDLANIFEH